MSKFDSNKIMPRYSAIALVMTMIAFAVVVKAGYIMTVKRSYWEQVADRVKKDSVSVTPKRGNILSCDGELMASSLPEFMVFMDFKQLCDAKNDSLWESKLDSICMGLNRIFPERSTKEFKSNLQEGFAKKSRHYPIWRRRIDYNTFTEIQALPIFKLGKFASGFHYEEFNARQRPYGSLAQRTLGDMFGAKDTARCGL